MGFDWSFISLIVFLIIAALFYRYLHKPHESFADINQPPVALKKALPAIRANLQVELDIIDRMTIDFDYFVKVSSNSKAENPQEAEKAKPKVIQDMANEAPGKIINLPYVKRIQDLLKTFTEAPEINRLYIAYILLPKETSKYLSSAEYLDIKGKQLYDYVASLGKSTPTGGSKQEQENREEMGKKTEKVRGSTGDTFDVDKALSPPEPPPIEPFANPDMPDCCTKNKVNELELNEEQISSLYYVSETRARNIRESDIESQMGKLASTYKKLKDLQSQVESGGGGTFGKIASGQSMETALINGFLDYNSSYAFLIR